MRLFRTGKERKDVFKRVDDAIRKQIEEAAQAFEPARRIMMEVRKATRIKSNKLAFI